MAFKIKNSCKEGEKQYRNKSILTVLRGKTIYTFIHKIFCEIDVDFTNFL